MLYKEESISVVISTRKIDVSNTLKIKKKFSDPRTEILTYENNNEISLSKLYNKGLEESKNNIVVFMHDDIDIETPNVAHILNQLFSKFPDYGIIGLAGTDELISGMWWEKREKMYGKVKHEHNGKIHCSHYSENLGSNLKEVVTVDGLFFAVHKERIKEKFDEEFDGFHFYDIPFCVLNHLKGVKIGVTTKIMVIHKSIGQVNEQWKNNKLFFEKKYGNNLPLFVKSF
jgi:glycosyltransferase involved in cell wall biosynthesis